MKKATFSRFAIFACCLVLAALVTAALVRGQSTSKTSASAAPAAAASSNTTQLFGRPTDKISTRPVILMSDGSRVGGGSFLYRTRDNVYGQIYVRGLTPGTVVTAWFGIFNNPADCATRPCSGADFANPAVRGSRVNFGGVIVGADGAATFGAFRTVGDTSGAFDGPGLQDPQRAEIHLVTRSHGLAITGDPAMLSQQLGTFNGGCPPNTCGNIHASIHQP
jgi:hypothetical protein